jgi:hypothetical protein
MTMNEEMPIAQITTAASRTGSHRRRRTRTDHDGEYQVTYEDRLHERELPKVQRHDLKDKVGRVRGGLSQSQPLPGQVQRQHGC